MPRIISIEDGYLLDGYKATGMSPQEIKDIIDEINDPAPMPLLYCVCPECGISLDIGERCECGKWQWGGDTNAQG